ILLALRGRSSPISSLPLLELRPAALRPGLLPRPRCEQPKTSPGRVSHGVETNPVAADRSRPGRPHDISVVRRSRGALATGAALILAVELAGYRSLHGVCKSFAPVEVASPTSARFKIECERGALELEVSILPSRGAHATDPPALF